MVKRILKRILVFSSVACLVLACLPSVSFAIDPVSGAAALAGALDAYGMAYGVGTVYGVSSSSGVSSSFEGLWDDFSEYQSSAGSQFDYDSFIEDYNQNRSLYGFEHSSGKFAAWSIDAESAEIFDQFWNWLLTGPAEMTRVDNEYFQFSQSQIGPESTPISVSSIISTSINGVPVAYGSSFSWNSGNYSYELRSVSGDPFYACVIRWSGGTYALLYLSSVSNFQVQNYLNGSPTGSPTVTSTSYRDLYCNNLGLGTSPSDYDIPLYPLSASYGTRNAAIELFGPNSGTTSISSSSSSIGVVSFDDTGVVDLPNPYGQDYVPTPLEIVTNVLWDASYDDTDEEDGFPVPFPPVDVPLVVDDILTSISAEDYALEEDPQDPDPDPPPPAPSEVFVPLLPVGLPSFNFSFSGIWHYVREWVSSLGAWFTTVFTIWGALPYAMVVPVYATAVVVIVLGVYKRFFM